MKKSTAIKAPTHLRKITQAWWEDVNAEYALELHHLKLLTLAAESWDHATQSREGIAAHGLTTPIDLGVLASSPKFRLRKQQRLRLPAYAANSI